jgi:hypothetical protein
MSCSNGEFFGRRPRTTAEYIPDYPRRQLPGQEQYTGDDRRPRTTRPYPERWIEELGDIGRDSERELLSAGEIKIESLV